MIPNDVASEKQNKAEFKKRKSHQFTELEKDKSAN